MAVGIISFLMIYFIPTFSTLFGKMKRATAVADAHHFGHQRCGCFALSGFLVAGARHGSWGFSLFPQLHQDWTPENAGWSSSFCGTPALGKVIAFFAMVRFCRLLGTLARGRRSAGRVASRSPSEAIGNQTLGDTVGKGIEEGASCGESLARSVARRPIDLFPSTVVEMIAIAEETARLDKELIRLSASYESELDRQLRHVGRAG